MSLICLGVVAPSKPGEREILQQKLTEVAKQYDRGIAFEINWYEPLLDSLADNVLVFSLSDCPECENCEMLLLPDGCFCNGRTNHIVLRERMHLLRDLAVVALSNGLPIEYYIGLSGTMSEEYDTITVRSSDLPQQFESLINPPEVTYAIHFLVH